MVCSAVRKVISIHTCENDITQSPARKRFSRILRFMRIQRSRRPQCLDTTKPATPSTRITHQHDRRRCRRLIASAPAIRYIGTARFLTHGIQLQPSQILLYAFVVCRVWDGRLEPCGQAGMFLFTATCRAGDHDCFDGVGFLGVERRVVGIAVAADKVGERRAGIEFVFECGCFASFGSCVRI